jgi:Ca2+-dependent lipid-binding protein
MYWLTQSLFLVVAADGLVKRDVFGLPDPFAVITVDSEQTHTTSIIKNTLNPYWNEHFVLSVLFVLACLLSLLLTNIQNCKGVVSRRSSDF